MSSPDVPVLYLMAPVPLYWTSPLAQARRYPFARLAGCEVTVECAEGMFADTRSWAAAWPALRERYSYGVFLDACGWVSRGVFSEVMDLAALGKPVWWFGDGAPARQFGFGPPDNRDWAGRYRRVVPLDSSEEACDSLGERRPAQAHPRPRRERRPRRR